MDSNAAPPPKDQRRLKALIVDDHRSQVEGIEFALRKLNLDVLFTDDGNKGLAIIKTTPLDIIILDLGMPGRSGFIILEQLRCEDIYNGPVIVVTGIEGFRHQSYAMTLGADAFFRKPYAIEEVVAKVAELLKI